ncbi:hypothetical protein H4Q26_015846, partial [Puccinia striiformis f. sp. tritici PST-130]
MIFKLLTSKIFNPISLTLSFPSHNHHHQPRHSSSSSSCRYDQPVQMIDQSDKSNLRNHSHPRISLRYLAVLLNFQRRKITS